MVLITNTEKRQLMLFPDPTLPVIPPREARDDVHNGDVAETIAMLALKLVGYHCLPSMQGKKYDFGVEIEDGDFLRVQVKGTWSTKDRLRFNFMRGFHGSKHGMFPYSPNDFEIACCVSLQDRKALFSPGVERSVSWTRAQFNCEDMEVISFEESLKAIKGTKGDYHAL